MSRVHVLDSTTSGGFLVYACGRREPKGNGLRCYVGRMLVKSYGSEVTCVACRKKCGLRPPTEEKNR